MLPPLVCEHCKSVSHLEPSEDFETFELRHPYPYVLFLPYIPIHSYRYLIATLIFVPILTLSIDICWRILTSVGTVSLPPSNSYGQKAPKLVPTPPPGFTSEEKLSLGIPGPKYSKRSGAHKSTTINCLRMNGSAYGRVLLEGCRFGHIRI